ncbi:hypothetical protein TNCV_3632551 [Trichonephila clavipes]|nr:hypothetical protein TNCV_3632551 [Trichonephila clavipes]
MSSSPSGTEDMPCRVRLMDDKSVRAQSSVAWCRSSETGMPSEQWRSVGFHRLGQTGNFRRSDLKSYGHRMPSIAEKLSLQNVPYAWLMDESFGQWRAKRAGSP